jgi:thymidylate synthase
MNTFKAMYQRLKDHGKFVSPRGQKTLEIENALTVFEPYERFANFPSRKLNLNYIKDEILWYLRGDLYDLSICDKAKIWKDCVTDGKLNSNYGHAIFKQKQLDYVVECLKKDPDSRRAVIVILAQSHLYLENKDVPCTISLNFRLRDSKLSCTVHMRSSDAIFGYSNDVPFFSFIQECVLVYLNARLEKELELGSLTIFSESLHIYERHFEMLEKLVHEYVEPVNCPRLSSYAEIDFLRLGHHFLQSTDSTFTQWLYARDAKPEKAA